MKKNLNNFKGITLIALVITIIILIILTATTILYSTSSGIFEKSALAKFRGRNATNKR